MSSGLLFRRWVLCDAEQIPLGVSQRRPLHVRHLVEHVPSVRRSELKDALDLRHPCTPRHREVDMEDLDVGTGTFQRLEEHREPTGTGRRQVDRGTTGRGWCCRSNNRRPERGKPLRILSAYVDRAERDCVVRHWWTVRRRLDFPTAEREGNACQIGRCRGRRPRSWGTSRA